MPTGRVKNRLPRPSFRHSRHLCTRSILHTFGLTIQPLFIHLYTNYRLQLFLCIITCFSCISSLFHRIFTPLPVPIQQHSGGGIFVRFAQIIVTFSPISCASCTNTLHIVVMNNCTYYILCFLSHINNTETRSVSGLF